MAGDPQRDTKGKVTGWDDAVGGPSLPDCELTVFFRYSC